MTETLHTVETLFDALFDEPPDARATFYREAAVPGALAGLVEELLAAHASADFDLPEVRPADAEDLGDLAPLEYAKDGSVVDGRYRVEKKLGEGTFGAVYLAHDLEDEAQVALKLPTSVPLAHAILEREGACLRSLRGGVAALRARGHAEGRPYLVTDFVEGRPFPGADGSSDPGRLVVALAKSLATVHGCGVVHRDLKPENVLVTPDGDVVLIDFGIAHGPAFAAAGADRQLSRGSRDYAAPEQLDGAIGDARSDVYSCALMGLRLFTGLPAAHIRTATRGEMKGWLADHAEKDLTVLNVLTDVLSCGASDRPDHAGALLERMGIADPARQKSRRGSFAAAVEAALASGDTAALFTGIEPLLRLRSGGAAELERRAGTDPSRALEVLSDWIERGLAFRREGQIQLHPPGLDALRAERLVPLMVPLNVSPGGTSERAGSHTPEGRKAFLQAVAEERQELESLGQSGRVETLLAEALGEVREWPIGCQHAEKRLVPWVVKAAVQRDTSLALDRAAFEVARSRLRGEERAALDDALAVARASGAGEHERVIKIGFKPPSATDEAEAQRAWQAVEAAVLSHRVRSSFSVEASAGRAVRHDAVRRARRARDAGSLRARRCLWAALRAYRLGHYSRSAALHRASAEYSESASDQARAHLNAASAFMEAWEFEAARNEVARASAVLEVAPFPTLEARAVWTRRTLAFRSGDLPTPDSELDGAFIALGALRPAALHALTEAAVAYHRGDHARTQLMAESSRKRWKRLGGIEAAAVCRALSLAAGAPPLADDGDTFDVLDAGSEPGIGLQVAALAPSARARLAELIPAWVARFARVPQGHRLDVLDTQEVATALGLSQDVLKASPIS